MKTILAHFYNEEYLLHWWLKHHSQFFDHGIMINYGSTDASVDIIKKTCPTWNIIDTKNKWFIEPDITNEIEDYEKTINGWRICLNVTEFLHGNFQTLTNSTENKHFIIPQISIIDELEERESSSVDPNLPLHHQFFYGETIEQSLESNGCRSISNYCMKYPEGRHFKTKIYDTEFIILKYKFCPMTKELFKRKLQIQHKIPYKDMHIFKNGDYHTHNGLGLTEEVLKIKHAQHKYFNRINDVSNIIKQYTK